MLYFSDVQSHINYALSVWGPMLKVSDLKKIKIQENKSIRLIFKVGRRARLSELYKKAHLLMVEDMIE